MDKVLVNRSHIRHDFLTGNNKPQFLTGHKGRTFLESGYIYAPYVPMQITTTICEDPNDFQPTEGMMTRYATTVVNNRFYGQVTMDGLEFDNLGND